MSGWSTLIYVGADIEIKFMIALQLRTRSYFRTVKIFYDAGTYRYQTASIVNIIACCT